MLRTYFQETFYDMAVDVAQKYADIIREAIITGKPFDGEKQQGFFLSRKRGFEDKLYVGNVKRIESHLYYNGEELADDDQIVNVIMLDGPVTRDGDGCSYGSKDHRDQIMYANTIPQVVGHIFIINTPGGAASARIDYEQAIADCREKGKPTVAWVDGMCCSAGQLVAALCDRTIVMNGRHTMGCIGTMCAFWGVANGTVSQDGFRYIELVSVTSPDKNAEYREACDGKTEKLQADLDRLGEEFRETVRQNRPLVKEEHLTGKTFDADSVMGALVDEIGDYNRAIEAVFELANGTLPAARTIVAGEPPAEHPEGEGPEELAKLNEQQKAALANSQGKTMIVDDGHIKESVPGFFGPEAHEVAQPQNNNDMTEEEKKAAEAAAAEAAAKEQEQAAAQEASAAEKPEGEQPAGEAAEQHAAEAAEQAAGSAPGGSPAGEGSEAPAGEAGQTAAEALANAEAEIDRINETLHNAEALVEERDKTIADMQETLEATASDLAKANDTIAERDNSISEKDAAIEALTKERDEAASQLSTLNAQLTERDSAIAELQATIEAQKQSLAEKEAEIKELAGTATPMTDGKEGIPADNGVGEMASGPVRSVITADMTPAEIRAALRKKDEETKARRNKR